ncbi:hypothetical protein N657DRAFT_644474 [Parathielavia appendiculata]|uniref:Cytochrome b5 heme-binding domain-containing protein n=1 Tax=Parathielavia appendiculata TaxID=2587402 RepID=A0AAN6U0P6_9PEZI|nr:hypothetical protein N657DRAFT_644474 [Parathielavia appendiculata]
MALLGCSLILASVVLFCMRRPAWFSSIFGGPPRHRIGPPPKETPETEPALTPDSSEHHGSKREDGTAAPTNRQTAVQVPIPPLQPVIQHTAPVAEAANLESSNYDSAGDGQTTPKTSAVVLDTSIPAFSLSVAEPAPNASNPNRDVDPGPLSTIPAPTLMMPPPPRPPTLRPHTTSTSPSLALPPQRFRNNNHPLPARGQQQQQPGCSTLAPPPTHTSKPTKPSRAVVLTPGHSPLDWARLSTNPTTDLRGLPPGTPYLRVTPSMLRKMTGRRGKDAWTVLGGRVYNITPYLAFHPGGEPELLRGAGRDGTKLFGEVHPWVNYEGMLAACLVGIYVPEEEDGGERAGGARAGADMEAMD